MPLPSGTNGPNGLTVDPADSQRLYLSAWGVMRRDGDTGGGIFLSNDGGATWRNVLRESQHVYDVTVDPRDPNVLYACGFGLCAFSAVDRVRGPGWIGVAVLVTTTFVVAGGATTLIGWPLVLAAGAGALLTIGLRPSRPLPPPPLRDDADVLDIKVER